MKTLNVIIAVMLMAYGHTVSGQKVLDTIQANSQMNVALFFPSPIKQAITGNTKAIFTYNREEAQYFGLLQSTANTITNLLNGYRTRVRLLRCKLVWLSTAA